MLLNRRNGKIKGDGFIIQTVISIESKVGILDEPNVSNVPHNFGE